MSFPFTTNHVDVIVEPGNNYTVTAVTRSADQSSIPQTKFVSSSKNDIKFTKEMYCS